MHSTTNQNSPFGTNYMLFTLGYLFVAAIIIPLTFLDINDNIILQLISFIYNFVFLFTLIGFSGSAGLKPNIMPAVGTDMSQGISKRYF